MELVDIILSFIGKVFIFIICLFIGIRMYCIIKSLDVKVFCGMNYLNFG